MVNGDGHAWRMFFDRILRTVQRSFFGPFNIHFYEIYVGKIIVRHESINGYGGNLFAGIRDV